MQESDVRYRVLIVDDAPTVREALRWVLEEGLDVTVVGETGEGHTGRLLATELQPDVVILDIELPDIDGYTVARLIKTNPHPPHILFLSVHGDDYSRQQALAAGGDSFVEKGTGWLPLISELRRLLVERSQN